MKKLFLSDDRHKSPTTRPRHLSWLAALIVSMPVFTANSDVAASEWQQRATALRQEIRTILTLPTEKIPLEPITHRVVQADEYTIEAITYASEPKSRVTALFYLPKPLDRPVPAIVVACGHGGSKSCFYAQYAGQLYAKLGFACLVVDTIGEEEREASGRMGARGHDLYQFKDKTPEFVYTTLKRMVLGKIVWDLIRGVDYLETRREIDSARIGIVGYSLGGATAGCVAMLDDRIRASVICGWVFRARYGEVSKYCTRMPHSAFNRILRYDEMTALLAPHAPTLFMCGAKDAVIDSDEDGAATVRDLESNIQGANSIISEAGIDGTIQAEFIPESGHRPFFLSHRAVSWLQEYLMPPEQRRAVPLGTISFGVWVDFQGQQIEQLYNTERNERGLLAVDCGAVYRDPKELACFPERDIPDPEYTMQGWIETASAAKFPSRLSVWMEPQIWVRDSDEPIISLGEQGSFDDMHIFGPAVAYENGTFSMLYSGSRGDVQERVFRLGLATSVDGIHFKKSEFSPVYEYGDGKHSVLTPTFLRGQGGNTLRENALFRIWFSAADLSSPNALHTLYECKGDKLTTLSAPSPAQLENVYAPTVIREEDHYRLWYTDVSAEPWSMRHAYSREGKNWTVTEGAVLVVDQEWERDRLFYPTVVKKDGLYLMWYGAYWTHGPNMTAIGFAVSEDGLIWYKHPDNPVFRPDPSHPWESHYTTSQSVMCLEDGTWRMWYATRDTPPHIHKYFAIGTAFWTGPASLSR
ncbi:MAG: acetylxylan esterase [bacterium]